MKVALQAKTVGEFKKALQAFDDNLFLTVADGPDRSTVLESIELAENGGAQYALITSKKRPADQ